MYLILFGISLLILLILLRSFYARKIQYRTLSELPGPPSNLLWGNLFQFTRNIEDTFDDINQLNKKYGPLVVLWSHPWKPLVVVAHPKFIERITSTNAHLARSSVYDGMIQFLGMSIVTSGVERWKRIRKLVNPAFQPQILQEIVPVLEHHGNKFIEILKKQCEISNIELPAFVDLYVLDVICEIMTNVRTNYQEISDNGYLEARSKYLSIFMNRAYSWLKRWDFFFQFTKECAITQECVVTIKKFSQQILDKAQKGRAAINEDTGVTKSVLDLLLDAGISNNEVRDNLDAFIVAGHDTPGSAIAFALFEIARSSEIQDKIVEESISVFGNDSNPVITIQDMRKLVYLECVIKETLRHHSIIQAHERVADEDITIAAPPAEVNNKLTKYRDGITIPKGTEVSVAIFAVHHNAEYYPDPDVFDPDRFLPENLHKIQPYTFIPFTRGPRDCIGKTLAMLLMKSVITKVIRKFILEPVDPPHKIKLTSEFVLKSANGLPVKMKPRKW